MKLLLDKQEKQILLLDKEARQYASKVRQKDQNIADTRERQRMMGKSLFNILENFIKEIQPK